jgi:Spy/CpxP family protein refolding chaperone
MRLAVALIVTLALGTAFMPVAAYADDAKPATPTPAPGHKHLTPEQRARLKERIKERLKNMTPEQREKLKERLKNKRAAAGN